MSGTEKTRLIKVIPLSLFAGIAAGGIYGTFEFLQRLRYRDLVMAGRSTLQVFHDFAMYYSLVMGLVIFAAGVAIILILWLIQRFWREEDFLQKYALHACSAAVAVMIYFHYVSLINQRYLPTAFDLYNLLGNVLIVFADGVVYLLLFLLLRMIHASWSRLLPFVRGLLIAAGGMFLLNVAAEPMNWMMQKEQGERPSSLVTKGDSARPNIILLTIDTLRPDYLGCYGSKLGLTPNLDQLALEGILYRRAFSTSPWTVPSLVTILTSLYPEVHGVNEYRGLDPARTTVAEVFREHGYATAASLSNPFLKVKSNIPQGFDFLYHADEPGFLKRLAGTRLYDILGYINAKVIMNENADNITDQALAWLRDRPKGPFFMWLHYIDPHLPYGGKHMAQFPRDNEYHGPIGSYWGDIVGVEEGRVVLTEEDKNHLRHLYSGDVFFTDQQVGRLWEYLRNNGLWDKTAVVFTSDHGEEFWEHGWMHHGHNQHVELIHVPLIIKPVGRGEPRVIEDQVSLIDLAPTVLDLAGIEKFAEMQGASLLPGLRGEGDTGTDIAFSSFTHVNLEEQKAMRQDGYALIYYTQQKRYELFYLNEDPWEKNDIYREAPEIAEVYKKRLQDYIRESALYAKSLSQEDERLSIQYTEQEKERLRALGYTGN